MVLWICLAVVVLGLGVLLVLLLELRAKQRRLQTSLKVAQKQVDQVNAVVSALQVIEPPTLPATPTRHVPAR